jgi:transposase
LLEVPDVHAIRTMHQRGVSKRQIAKTLGISRTTVDRYTAPDFLAEATPQMRLRRPRPAPKMDQWKPIIDEWLAADDGVPRKQRRTARKVFKDLKKIHEVGVSEVSVRRYVAAQRQTRAKKAYVPLDFALGEMVEVDFGEVRARIGGVEQGVHFLVMRLMASGVHFAKAYPHAKLEAWLDGIATGLSFLGGVPAKAMFDNDTALVRKVLGDGRRVRSPEFRALSAHYGVEVVFANRGAGNEKGGVEKAVFWAQRNLFSPVPEAASFEALNAMLAAECLADARSRRRGPAGPLVADLWEAEQHHLAELPRAPFPACRTRFARVDKTLLTTYDGARYSAPATCAGKGLTLRAFWDRIELADREGTVAVHERQQAGGSSLQLEHYLPVLAAKPRAVAHAAVIAEGAPAIARYRDAFLAVRPGAYRELVAILRLGEDVGVSRLAEALGSATRHRAFDLESVRAIIWMTDTGGTPAPALEQAWLARWPRTPVQEVCAGAYDWLTEVAAGSEVQ